MKNKLLKILAFSLLIFGLLTLFLSFSIIADLFGIREMEGNYVPLVVWANLFSSIFYIIAAFGLFRLKKWPALLLWISIIILIGAFIGLRIHINAGGLYEAKTVKALIFRIALTIIFAIAAYMLFRRKKLKM